MQQSPSRVRLSGAVPFDAAGMEVHVLLSPQDLFPFPDAPADGPIEPGRMFESYESQIEAFLSSGWRWVDGDPRCVGRAITHLSDIQAIVEENGDFMLFGCPLHVAVLGSDGERQVAGGTLAGSGTFEDLLPPKVLPTLVHSTASCSS